MRKTRKPRKIMQTVLTLFMIILMIQSKFFGLTQCSLQEDMLKNSMLMILALNLIMICLS